MTLTLGKAVPAERGSTLLQSGPEVHPSITAVQSRACCTTSWGGCCAARRGEFQCSPAHRRSSRPDQASGPATLHSGAQNQTIRGSWKPSVLHTMCPLLSHMGRAAIESWRQAARCDVFFLLRMDMQGTTAEEDTVPLFDGAYHQRGKPIAWQTRQGL